MFEHGSGPPLVLIPGIPGPWEYMRPAVEALAASYRVLTFSLGPECSIESDVARIGQDCSTTVDSTRRSSAASRTAA